MQRRSAPTSASTPPDAANTAADAKRRISSPPPAGAAFSAIAVVAAALCSLHAHRTLSAYVPPASGEFDAADAERVLLTLCAVGPRTVGSTANERHAVEILQRELVAVAEEASRHGAILEVERQQSSGAFYTDFLNGFTNAYQNVTNVVAKLSWPSPTPAPPGLLIGAHFDTAPGSPGAGDNAVNVAAALGVLRNLARQSGETTGRASRRPVLLLLSGSEEVNWVGAHGFATQHRWAAEYGVVINLEALGSGGMPMALQLGPAAPWLAEAMGATHEPRGSILAQVIMPLPVSHLSAHLSSHLFLLSPLISPLISSLISRRRSSPSRASPPAPTSRRSSGTRRGARAPPSASTSRPSATGTSTTRRATTRRTCRAATCGASASSCSR